ncbi:putative branched-chain-amino-acid aminotransferase [Agrobacterium sp. DSM 25558]|uniref:aminotransferase class IV family protein n=1 Tax=Agrobacterium sp. DSM 25558 TaxID=1907665 RepID=UPI0009725EC0|nr:aminotransferase class IV family protein [Agrobacterium sp. DSM 25558]SCX24481.1 putative branched-chain-amino-acid aminotransferase [Agrobacterium sp. DSM 25558]
MKRKPADLTLRETLRWEPDTGFRRLEQHLRRLLRSADALGFRAPADTVKALNAAVCGNAPLTVRVVMNYKGELDIAAEPFVPLQADAIWRVRIAQKTRLDSADTFYRHKSSRREPYDAARAEFSTKDADEVLLLNERGEICEGSTTSIFVEGAEGQLLTPPLDSGILPGVLRADLIRERRARGQALRPDDLKGRKLFVGNSLHGLVAAELV